MENVAFKREEYKKHFPLWEQVFDCLQGGHHIKECGEKYLPYPWELRDGEVKNMQLYNNYKSRALFYNVIPRTITELQGYVFSKTPLIKIDESNTLIQKLRDNATGNGSSLVTTAKTTLYNLLAFARGGIFVDYPLSKRTLSKRELDEGLYRPTITNYSAFNIINWRVEDFGAEEKLTLVVLKEKTDIPKDNFEVETVNVIRVLRLENGIYRQYVYIGDKIGKDYKLTEEKTVYDFNGKTLDYIPFYFVGLNDNSPSIDYPEMYNLSELVISCYRNSADNEEALFISGQPTLVISGLKRGNTSVKGNLETQPAPIKMGARNAIQLDNGGTGSLIQYRAGGELSAAIEQKKSDMAKFGATFLRENKTEKTAYQVRIENQASGSILSNATDNISRAYTQALIDLHKACGLPYEEVIFELNSMFDYNRLTIEELNTVISLANSRYIPFGSLIEKIQEAGLISKDISKEDYKALENLYNSGLLELKDGIINKGDNNDTKNQD